MSKRMKYLAGFLEIFLLFICFSCSNNQTALITYDNENTLKTQLLQKEDDVLWTKEIEGNLLVEDIKKNPYISLNNISANLMNVISNQYEEIYPEYENFALLDVRNIPEEIRENLTGFCNLISTDIYSSPEKYISSDFMFTYIFFLNELKDGWNKNFKSDFPAVDLLEDVGKNDDKTENKAENGNTEEAAEEVKEKLFTSYILGQPFNSDNYIQIPVRLYNSYGFVDILIYMNNSKPYLIYNIEISRWERTHE